MIILSACVCGPFPGYSADNKGWQLYVLNFSNENATLTLDSNDISVAPTASGKEDFYSFLDKYEIAEESSDKLFFTTKELRTFNISSSLWDISKGTVRKIRLRNNTKDLFYSTVKQNLDQDAFIFEEYINTRAAPKNFFTSSDLIFTPSANSVITVVEWTLEEKGKETIATKPKYILVIPPDCE